MSVFVIGRDNHFALKKGKPTALKEGEITSSLLGVVGTVEEAVLACKNHKLRFYIEWPLGDLSKYNLLAHHAACHKRRVYVAVDEV